MKHFLYIFVIFTALAFSTFAQKPGTPTLEEKPATPSQETLIKEGLAFFQSGKYDEAIPKFEQVVTENPDCTPALYNLALSFYNKPDKAKADEIARKGAQYRSEMLPLFYILIANGLDDGGKSQDAIDVYKEAIGMLKGKSSLIRNLAEANFNLGYAFARQQKYPEARAALKDAVEANFSHPTSHFLLAQIYAATKYRIPALLASARFMGLAQNNAQTKRAAEIFLDILKPAPKDEKGNINIFMNLDGAKDEGDFAMYDLILGTLTISKDKKDKKKTTNELFVEGVATVIAILSEDKDIPSTFVGRNYVPYMEAMHKAGHDQALAYLILKEGGNKDAEKWVSENAQKIADYYAWAKAYQSPLK